MSNKIAAALSDLGFPADKITSASILVDPTGPVSVQLVTYVDRDEAAGLIQAVKGDRTINTVVVTDAEPARGERKLILGGDEGLLIAYVEDEQGVRREIEPGNAQGT